MMQGWVILTALCGRGREAVQLHNAVQAGRAAEAVSLATSHTPHDVTMQGVAWVFSNHGKPM